MLDMGFIHDIRKVLALPKKRQNLLFSATFSDEIHPRRQLPVICRFMVWLLFKVIAACATVGSPLASSLEMDRG